MKKLLLISLMSMSLFAADDEQKLTSDFIEACKSGNIERAQELLNSDNEDAKRLRDACTMGPNRYERVQKLLEDGADPNQAGLGGIRALHWATQCGLTDIAQLLLDYGANINQTDAQGSSPLQYACFVNNADHIKFFLKNGANVNQADNEGTTPLHLASFWKVDNVIMPLLAYGADKNAINSKGQTAEDIARERGHNDLADFIQKLKLVLPLRVLTLNMINQDPELRAQLKELPKPFSWYPEIEFESEENNQAASSSSSHKWS